MLDEAGTRVVAQDGRARAAVPPLVAGEPRGERKRRLPLGQDHSTMVVGSVCVCVAAAPSGGGEHPVPGEHRDRRPDKCRT